MRPATTSHPKVRRKYCRECHAMGCVLGGGDLDRLAGHGHYTTAVVDRRDCHLGLAGRAGLAASASATGLSASCAST